MIKKSKLNFFRINRKSKFVYLTILITFSAILTYINLNSPHINNYILINNNISILKTSSTENLTLVYSNTYNDSCGLYYIFPFDMNKNGLNELIEIFPDIQFIKIKSWNGSKYIVATTLNLTWDDYEPIACSVGDVDNDGQLELIIFNRYENWYSSKTYAEILIYNIETDLSLTYQTQILPSCSDSGLIIGGVGDFDGDGYKEILFHEYKDNTGRYGIYDWNGNNFLEVMGISGGFSYGEGEAVLFRDVTGDGKDDPVFFFGYSNSKNGYVELYQYSGGTYSLSSSIDVGRDAVSRSYLGNTDIDGDGLNNDLVVKGGATYHYTNHYLHYSGASLIDVKEFNDNGDNEPIITAGELFSNNSVAEVAYEDGSNVVISTWDNAINSFIVKQTIHIGDIDNIKRIYIANVLGDYNNELIVLAKNGSTQFKYIIYSTNSIEYKALNPPILNKIEPNPDTDGNVTLHWSSVEGASSYLVYRDTECITDINNLTAIVEISGTT
ncbi:MAG: hypothetical protein ACTSVC_06705, partial [Promethearchaeota archaeon]